MNDTREIGKPSDSRIKKRKIFQTKKDGELK